MRLEDGPGIAVELDGRGDELGAVDDRAATYGEQKVELLAAHLLDGLDQGLVGGIWLDAPELLHLAMTESRLHFGECSSLAGAFAAEQHQETGRGRYQHVKSRNRASAENDAGGVVELEI